MKREAIQRKKTNPKNKGNSTPLDSTVGSDTSLLQKQLKHFNAELKRWLIDEKR